MKHRIRVVDWEGEDQGLLAARRANSVGETIRTALARIDATLDQVVIIYRLDDAGKMKGTRMSAAVHPGDRLIVTIDRTERVRPLYLVLQCDFESRKEFEWTRASRSCRTA